jgi:hypothetical protein
MISQIFRLMTKATLAVVAVAWLASGGHAQQIGDIGGGIGTDTGGIGNTGGTTGGDLGTGTGNTGGNLGTTSGNTGNIGGGGSAGRVPDLSNILNIEGSIPVLEDKRRQPFVGATSELGRAVDTTSPATGFVGPDSSPFTSGAATGGSAGRTPGGTTGSQGAPAGTGQQNGFVVTRKGIRSRVTPAFRASSVDGDFVSTQFQSRMQRQPSTSSMANSFERNVQVNVQNRTAVVTGVVASAEQADRIVRQLQLQPGIYKIENRLTVGN